MKYRIPFYVEDDEPILFHLFINEEHIDSDYELKTMFSWVADVKLTGEALDGDVIAIVTTNGNVLFAETV